jgi:hypothetical protein
MTAEDAMAKIDEILDEYIDGVIVQTTALTRIARFSGQYGLSNLDRAGI